MKELEIREKNGVELSVQARDFSGNRVRSQSPMTPLHEA